MVELMPRSWLADLKARLGSGIDPGPDDCLGILAFEAAATMARLVSVHNSLSAPKIQQLRSHMRSEGISYLTSPDQAYLLRLACGEILSDLDRAADGVSRLCARCRSVFPRAFSRVYPDAKKGSLVALLEEFKFTKGSEKRVRKMEKHVALAARLYGEMDTLNDLEASERRMDEWKKHSGPIPMQQKTGIEPTDLLRRELRAQRQRVRKLMDESLWQMSFDKAVGIMAKSALSNLHRISTVFGQYVPGLPPILTEIESTNGNNTSESYSPNAKARSSSGPIPLDQRPSDAEVPLRHSAPIFARKDAISDPLATLVKSTVPPPSSVGSAGMALRYANVILSAEKLLAMRSGDPLPQTMEDDEWGTTTREELYEMLPVGVRAAVKAKLKNCWKNDARAVADRGVADGWGQVVKGLLSWLGPMARETERWQEERNLDRMQRFATGPRTLALKTLHFADLIKTEAAMVEVLVGLSCICWYHQRHARSAR